MLIAPLVFKTSFFFFFSSFLSSSSSFYKEHSSFLPSARPCLTYNAFPPLSPQIPEAICGPRALKAHPSFPPSPAPPPRTRSTNARGPRASTPGASPGQKNTAPAVRCVCGSDRDRDAGGSRRREASARVRCHPGEQKRPRPRRTHRARSRCRGRDPLRRRRRRPDRVPRIVDDTPPDRGHCAARAEKRPVCGPGHHARGREAVRLQEFNEMGHHGDDSAGDAGGASGVVYFLPLVSLHRTRLNYPSLPLLFFFPLRPTWPFFLLFTSSLF